MAVIGGVAGMLAGILMKGKGFGILLNIVLGISGAILSGWLSKFVGISFHGNIGQFIAALLGAVLILFVLKKIKG